MNRREILVALLALGAAPLGADSQPLGKVRRVGVLGVPTAASYAPQIEALRKGFRDLGYIEGQNLLVDYRWADGRIDRLPALAAELIGLQPDLIVTSGAGTRALKDATTAIPIVMAAGGDAVAAGLVASLAQPGGNITGSTFFGPELSAKRVELLKEAVPHLAKVAVLINPRVRDSRVYADAMKKTSTALNVELLEVPVRSPKEFDDAFAQVLRQRAEGVVVTDDSMLVANMRRLGELSVANRLPAAGSAEFAEGGGLLVYGVNFSDLWGRAPLFVDKIFKGMKPAQLPVERAVKFTLALNLNTAKLLNIKLPQSVLMRADDVIR